MTKTQNTKTTWINFRTDKNGKRTAYRFDRSQHRSFRIGLDAALLMIATGAAQEEMAR